MINEFIKKFSNFVLDMNNSSHHGQILNEFHLEDDVWTHTKMVYEKSLEFDKINQIIALCHDIGKPISRYEHSSGKIKFSEHERVSAFLMLDVLNHFKNQYSLNEQDIINIFLTINNHDVLYKLVKDYSTPMEVITKLNQTRFESTHFEYLIKQTYCDLNGRISKDPFETDFFNEYIFNESLEIVKGLPNYKKKDNPFNTVKTNQPIIHYMIGLPCSGKSTYIKNNQDKFKDFIIISRDNIIQDLGSNNYNYDFKMLNNNKIDKIINEKYITAVKNKENIIIDMTMMNHISRSRYNPIGYQRKATIHLTPLKIIFERNKNRKNKTIPINFIYDLIKNFELPLKSEIKVLDFNINGFD